MKIDESKEEGGCRGPAEISLNAARMDCMAKWNLPLIKAFSSIAKYRHKVQRLLELELGGLRRGFQQAEARRLEEIY